MRHLGISICVWLGMVCPPLFTQESRPSEVKDGSSERVDARAGNSWTRALKDRAQRGTLHDAFRNVRGDSGKWSDEPILLHAPPIAQKPAAMSLDNWVEHLPMREFQLTGNDDNWLLFCTRQLDDNDRVWVERIERRGNRFTVVLNEAIWQGRYSKTFTYYSVMGVNLGKLEPGQYEAKWIIQPLAFRQFEGDGRPTDNWPKDERPADRKPIELFVAFQVSQPKLP